MDYHNPIAYNLRVTCIRCGQSSEEFEGIALVVGKIKAKDHIGKFKGRSKLCSPLKISQLLALPHFYWYMFKKGWSNWATFLRTDQFFLSLSRL